MGEDREPQPTDGPDYHAEHAAWVRRQSDQPPALEPLTDERALTIGAQILAIQFHDTYERLAPEFGYETRAESAVPWSEVPENNRNLMIATVRTVLADQLATLAHERALRVEAERRADRLVEAAIEHDAESHSLRSLIAAAEAEVERLRGTLRAIARSHTDTGTGQFSCAGPPLCTPCYAAAALSRPEQEGT